MNRQSAKRRGAHALIYDRVCERVLHGDWPAGTRLKEEEIAKEFAVSRTPIREVFRLLAADGLIRLIRNRGAMVTGFTTADIEDLYDIRRELELLVIECAGGHLPLAKLQEWHREMVALRNSSDPAAHTEWDYRFHDWLHESAGRRRLSDLLRQQCRLMQHFRHLGFRSPAQRRKVSEEHLAIIEALLRRDVQGAKAAMVVHLINSKLLIMRWMSSARPEQTVPSGSAVAPMVR
jgi:DNA-binding GntR family transcriptional regulator